MEYKAKFLLVDKNEYPINIINSSFDCGNPIKDIESIITLCLRHRCRRDPMESINSGEKIDIAFQKIFIDGAV